MCQKPCRNLFDPELVARGVKRPSLLSIGQRPGERSFHPVPVCCMTQSPEVPMLISFSYEEITALTHGAHRYLDEWAGSGAGVLAPPAERSAIEMLLDRLDGDFSLRTLEEQQHLEQALHAIVTHLRQEMEGRVAEEHPAAEAAVAAYFDFAHTLSVLSRIRDVGDEMTAMVEVISGEAPTETHVRNFVFPD